MINSFVILSLLTSVALAQSPTPSATANPLIPTGISSNCTSFLTSLNSDASLTSCTSSLIDATSAYGPGGSGSNSPSADSIDAALGNLCATASSSCPESLLHGKIADFYVACPAELTSNPNDDVLAIYDVLYALTPLKSAVCSKDDGGNYCVTQTKSAASAPTTNNVANASSIITSTLARRADTTAITPNITAYHETNLPFLFLVGSLSSDILCTACTRNILAAYINFESNVPYAAGISQSPLLSGQSALYVGVQATCGKTFLGGTVQAAGGLSGGTISSSGASRSAGQQVEGLIAAMMGLAAFSLVL